MYQLTLVKNGIEEKIDLGFSGSRLLERLVRNPGEVVDRDDLMSHAWSGRVVGQGSLNQQIYTLRQILADEKEREIIQTLPRRGYLLNPKFVDISIEQTPAINPPDQIPVVVANTASTELAVTPVKQPTGFDWRMPGLVGLSALIALGGAIAYNLAAETAQPIVPGKLLTVIYAPQHPQELLSLVPLGENIERRITPHVKTSLQVVVGLHENKLDLVCLRADGSARTLHIDENRLNQLTDNDLAPCLL
ncbi:winged helix-turn-helix domain-containing protein [Cellvibrio mixtus]|uniref:winged helix-turn-helix domain-containing protein n=1 Tax=Cellvibrio mixtus TaxID=39650 RepID=UPI0039963102